MRHDRLKVWDDVSTHQQRYELKTYKQRNRYSAQHTEGGGRGGAGGKDWRKRLGRVGTLGEEAELLPEWPETGTREPEAVCFRGSCCGHS